jgi:hypothetical protein
LQSVYQVSCGDELPAKRPKAEWIAENKIGFFKGICHFGREEDVCGLIKLLQSPEFKAKSMEDQQKELQDVLEEMYSYYIAPFKTGVMLCMSLA